MSPYEIRVPSERAEETREILQKFATIVINSQTVKEINLGRWGKKEIKVEATVFTIEIISPDSTAFAFDFKKKIFLEIQKELLQAGIISSNQAISFIN